MDHRRVVEGRVISEFPDAETFTLLLGDQATEQSSSVRVRLMSLWIAYIGYRFELQNVQFTPRSDHSDALNEQFNEWSPGTLRPY